MLLNNDRSLRFTLDYIDDFKCFNKVILSLSENMLLATDQDIINLVKQNNSYISESSYPLKKGLWENLGGIESITTDG